MSSVDRERFEDLLLRRETDRLDDAEQAELAELLAALGAEGDATSEELELAAGAALHAFARQDALDAPLPGAVRERLVDDANQFFDAGGRSDEEPSAQILTLSQPASPERTATSWTAWSGWAVAAGLALVFVLGDRSDAPAGVPSPAEARTALAAEAPDATVLPWAPSREQGYESVRGEVLWSTARQAGYLRLAGMPTNDPDESQYQLWIVDPDRDSHPVDGGVFDVPPGQEVIVPVDAKLPIARPALFAITLERPGGVVVSSEPLLLRTERAD